VPTPLRTCRARWRVVAEGPVVASQRQGVAGELVGTTGRVPGNTAEVGLTDGGGRLRGGCGGSVRRGARRREGRR
jgi:hypothetical protein